jgi:hypothetical protein
MVEARPERDEHSVEPEAAPSQLSEPPGMRPFISKEKLTNNTVHTSTGHQTQQRAEQIDIELVSAVACQGVQNHQHIDNRNVFYTSDTHRAYVWMEIRSKEQPFVIKHIYYLNDQKYCEVPLDIKYSRMRTWSYITLDKEDHTGSWKVEIVCNNRVLKTVRFIVKD